ncbi:N-6 DNA methylase [Ahrensia sp. 13_GOM-1096m]|uniref:N-6 DNA methylase n=1 Tax=Ahrensia sp. 13_GOM-1096m TaxID=1380380 RepID=UPI00047B0788|nr:N-6 DNA methylase [Ahrensia sp. 13_GOM-1096m]
MLDSETKRRIDTCRDILVGKVPDPKSQVEQITVALIYKFMDDMDLEAEELGGKVSFFTGEYKRYRWSKLVAPGVTGQEMLNTYSEALTKMVENVGLPELFRSIFRNAYLPYRDPETLRSFLREINGFSYENSERLGDAFEYLLSVLGSQGDAGQFRTPRHIIDFMVEIIDPKKNEVIMDPACGTAGFLISAYKHILKNNSTNANSGNGVSEGTDASEQALESPLRYAGDLLSQADRALIAKNIKGYDISPDMVRLSLVNLYLHGFADPKIEEYDTLTSEDKWGEMADVILANPPFMSPKGGIKPHTKFQVQSKRSEVLFVDYIAEHLTPQGRAAIVVPEGVVFQSQSAYVALRKMLEASYLAAVISLPAGVFNPYSGVKTSILILDRAVAKASKHVAFFKIENDGFALGAQRKAQKGSELQQVKAELSDWLQAARAGGGEELESQHGFSVKRTELIENEFNFSGELYRTEEKQEYAIPRVPIGEICKINPPKSQLKELDGDTEVSFAPMADLNEWRIGFEPSETMLLSEVGSSYTYFADGDVLLAKVTPCFENGKAGIAQNLANGIGFGSSEYYVIRPSEKVLPQWIYRCVMHEAFRSRAIPQMTGTGGLQRVPRGFIERFEIPLPPLEVQREIVKEIESYQRVIDGARDVIDNYGPYIPIDPEWGSNKLKNLIETVTPKLKLQTDDYMLEGEIPIIDQSKELIAGWTNEVQGAIQPNEGLVIFGDHTCVVKFVDQPFVQGADGIKILKAKDGVLARYLAYFLRAYPLPQDGYRRHFSKLKEREILLPSPDEQASIVQELDAEQAIVDGNRDLIVRFEKKIDAAIARVWGEAKSADEAAA